MVTSANDNQRKDFLMSKIDLHHGDCLEVMDKLIKQGIKVDAIITDPPYGTTACRQLMMVSAIFILNPLKRHSRFGIGLTDPCIKP